MSVNNFDAQLRQIRDDVQKAERTKVQLETKKEESLKRKAEYEKRCEELGVKPGDINDELEKLEREIQKVTKEIRAALPAADSVDDDTPAF